jgi:hypothetical protein
MHDHQASAGGVSRAQIRRFSGGLSTAVVRAGLALMPIPILDDLISYGRLAWSAVTGLWRFSQRNKRKLTPQQKLEFRTKWKPKFNEFFAHKHAKGLRTDIIIRDMRRLDVYPNTSIGKGISSWFRVGLVDTYERGIMVGMRWEALVKEAEGYRLERWPEGEPNSDKVLLTGFIPYECIESVDWDGDDYYSFPHIYCYFDYKGEPYERVMFCKRGELDGWPYYAEVVDWKSVKKVSKKYDVKWR